MTNLLITGGTVITMDPARRVLDDGAVAIRGDRIVDVGPAAELRPRYEAFQVLDAAGMAVLPGLIDAHGHAGHCLTKGIAEHVGSAGWGELMERIYFHETTPDFWLAESRLAALERLKFGVTTGVSMVGSAPRCDDPIYAGMVARGYAELGTRVIVAIGTPSGPWPKRFTSLRTGSPEPVSLTFDQGIRTVEAAMREWHGAANGRVKVYPGPSNIMPSLPGGGRPFDPASPPPATQLDHDQAKAMRRLAEEFDTGIHSHAYGGMFKAAKDGSVDCLGPRYSLAHCAGISAEEVRIIADTCTNVVHGPLTRAHMNARCPVVELLEAGVTVVFGSDGTAPDRTFDVLEKLRFGMWTHRHHAHDSHLFPPGKALEMVTVDAAKALGLPELGSIEPGKLADLTLIDLRKPHLAPLAMVPQRIAYLASGQDVDTVIVGGEVLMQGRKAPQVDESAILRDADRAMWEVVERAGVQGHMGIPERFWGSVRY
jgi:5-methylthioadenosine/S-adenosylhomocysteine deaminase